MNTKFVALISVIGLASICVGQAQSPTPAESPSPAEEATASPSPTPKPTRKPKATPATSPTPGEATTAGASATPAKKRTPKAKTTPAATRAKTAAATSPMPAAGGPGLVWVNTDTHIYHKQGSRFYGKTKAGKYMSEAEARKEGNRPAAQEY